MIDVSEEEFCARYKKGGIKVRTFYEEKEYVTPKEVTPLPDGYVYKQKIAYINSETHDIAIKEEIFVERNR